MRGGYKLPAFSNGPKNDFTQNQAHEFESPGDKSNIIQQKNQFNGQNMTCWYSQQQLFVENSVRKCDRRIVDLQMFGNC